MENSVIVRGHSVEEALNIASKEMSVGLQELAYDILSEPSKGIFKKNKEFTLRIWKSSLLDTLTEGPLAQKHTNQLLYPSGPDQTAPPIYVSVKESGIFIKLEKDKVYTALALKDALRERGVIDEKGIDLARILSFPQGNLQRITDFKGMKGEVPALNLRVDKEKMNAYITMKPPKKLGGATNSYEEVLELLEGEGIVFGVLFENIKELVEHELIGQEVLVATGELPIDSQTVEYKRYGLPKEVGGKESIDLKERIVKYRSFKKGDLICEAIGSVLAKDGTNIYGQEIKSSHTGVIDTKLIPGPNVVNSEDGKKFFADIYGIVIEEDNKISMTSSIEIKENIGYNTGNLDLFGDVLIKGDVQDGFSVKSTGNIYIEGFVQKGNISAGGNITVQKGIFGGTIFTQGSLATHYIDVARVKVGGNIICKQEIVNSLISCGGYVLLYGDKASIVGGEVCIKEGLIANKVGSDFQNMKIQLGVDPPILEMRAQLAQEIEILHGIIAREEESIKDLLKPFASSKKVVPIEEKEALLLEHRELLDKLINEHGKIQDYIRHKKENGFLSVKSKMSLGVELTINNVLIPITEEVVGTTIRIENKKIRLFPYDSSKLEESLLNIKK